MTKGILYYTDNQLSNRVARRCRKIIGESGLPITSVSLKPVNFGHNIILPLERGYETMFTQILTGLEAMTEDIVYFCEHDTLYHPDHFAFNPEKKDVFYYNGNYWYLRLTDGFAIHYNVSPLSGLVAYREPLVTHFRERLAYIKENGFSLRVGFEPMTHRRIKWENWYDYEIFMPENPNVDLCHGKNATWKRWSPKDFRRKPTFWEESDYKNIPGWPNLPEVISPFFKPKEEPKVKKDSQKTLSILIPARNEEFLGRTIQSILDNIEGDTNIIAVLDGYDTEIPDIPEDPRVILIKHHEAIGQRAATNEACRLSKSKYVAKVDAHCSFDKGFDRILMENMQDDWTVVPIMRNLHAFDWVCKKCGATKYQGPTPEVCWTENCDGKEFERDIKWIGKNNPQSTAYCFDPEPHFQYFKKFKKRPEGDPTKHGNLTETMSLQGSFFMMTRDKYWELNICDEEAGNWGNQGIEVACKTWLTGGRVLCNHNTWYAHMFRTQGGDFSFPWPNSGRETRKTKEKIKDDIWNNKLPNQKYPVSWLVEKFWPVPGWTEEDLKKIKEIPLPN